MLTHGNYVAPGRPRSFSKARRRIAHRLFAKVVAFPWLTDASEWFLLKTNVAVRPFIFQDRKPPEFKALEHNSETGFLREMFLYVIRALYAIIYAVWQNIIRLGCTPGE